MMQDGPDITGAAKQTEKMLRKNAVEMWVEPILTTKTSFIKPDIMVDDGCKITTLDVSI